MKKALVLVALLSVLSEVRGQLYIDTVPIATRASVLAQTLAGKNVTVMNASMICPDDGAAKFRTVSDTIVGIGSGIVLTTGVAKTTYKSGVVHKDSIDDIGINLEATYGSTKWQTTYVTNDVQLNSISVIDTQYDRCRLEFDIIPRGDTIKFNYIFASEEYPSFVCNKFNDVFGLFISGNGITGDKNIAVVPNTSAPISINSVFDTTTLTTSHRNFDYSLCTKWGIGAPYTQYFRSNDSGDFMTYNGMTAPLTAFHPVTPLDTYHLTFIVAELIDGRWDSGVFIEENSLEATSLVIATPYSTGSKQAETPYMVESCGNVRLNFRTPKKLTKQMTVDLTYGGSAIHKVDYDSLPSNFIIPINDSTYDLYINPVVDALTEPSDSIIIYATNNTTYFDTIVYHIYDEAFNLSVFNATNDTTVCNKSVSELYINKSDHIEYDIVWSPSQYLSDKTILNPILSPDVATSVDSIIYNVNISHTGCTGSLDSQIIVYVNHLPRLTMIKDTLLCDDDTITIAPVLHSTGTHTYIWTPNVDVSDTSILNPRFYTQDTQLYRLQVTNTDGCSIYDSVMMNGYKIKSKIVNIVTTDANCHRQGGKIEIYKNTLDTLFYTLNNITQIGRTFSNLKDSIYPTIISHPNGCRIDTNIIVNRKRPNIQFSSTIATCNNADGSINVTVIDANLPIDYNWSSGPTSMNLNNVAAGAYTLTITDNINCKDTASFELFSTAPTFDIEKKDAFCTDDNGKLKLTNITGTEPITYLWNTGTTVDSIDNLSSGSYEVTVTDSSGCAITQTDTIDFINSPVISYTSKPVTCITDKGRIAISATQGQNPYTFFCSNGTTGSVVNNLSGPQSYQIKVVDTNNCVDSTDVFIDSIPKLSATYTTDSSYCSLPNGNIYITTMDGSSPFTYNWNDGNTAKDNLNIDAGNYQVTITDDYNCSIVVSNIRVGDILPIFTNQTTKTDLRCYQLAEGEVVLGLNGGFSPYQYNFDNQGYATNSQYSNLLSGKYYYDIRDNRGCVYSDSVTLNQPSSITIDSKTVEDASCYASQDGSIEIQTSGGILPHTYLWSNSSTNSQNSNLGKGIYFVTITDDSGCTITDNYTVNSPDSFMVVENITPSTCYHEKLGEIQLTIQGGTTPYRYLWSNQSTEKDQKQLLRGKYQLTLTDKNNCTQDYEYEITSPPPIQITNIIKTLPICYGESNGAIQLRATGGAGGFLYKIQDRTAYESQGSFRWLESENYAFYVKDKNNCEIDTTITLRDPIKTEIEILPSDTTVVVGESFPMTYNVIKGDKSVNSILWTPNHGLSCNDCKTPTVTTYVTREYDLEVIDTNGCIATSSSKVYVQDSMVLFIPNSFSPNGDQKNDIFMVYGKYILKVKMMIFNRWGEKVFQTDAAQFSGWDGKYKGKYAPIGIYKYFIEITTLSQRKIEKSGNVLLVR